MKILITGLESSCTRIVSKLVAINLELINNEDEWDAHESICNQHHYIEHKSLPHGAREDDFKYIDEDYSKNFDIVIISTRDLNCVSKSKLINHQPLVSEISKENNKGIEILKKIMSTHKNFYIFSYESALLLQDSYIKMFLSNLSIPHVRNIEFNNINKKYMIED